MHASQHVSAQIDVGNYSQLLVDDYLIHEWENVVRVLEPPREKDILDLDEHEDVRYGCPCSAVETDDGKVRLFYSSGPSIIGAEEDSWEEDHCGIYSYRDSADGHTGWTGELGKAEVEGREHLATLSIVGSGRRGQRYTLPPRPGHGGDSESANGFRFMAGYEGRRGRACIAYSDDGTSFSNLDNEEDRSKEGLNDDCLTEGSDYAGANSILARAADTYITPVVDTVHGKEYVWYRKDFGTNAGWREVRGLQVVELQHRFAEIRSAETFTDIQTRHAEWYFDRLGKLERFRRHIYALSLTPYAPNLWIGTMTVIEWPKDLGEERCEDCPAFERDTLNVYFVTSRDGKHVDHEWVYAHKPLLPRDGVRQEAFDSGMIFPGGTFLTRPHEHRIYYEARSARHHEERFDGNQAKLATTSWARDRLVALRAAHLNAPAVVTTKAFAIMGGAVEVEVDASPCGASVRVEVITESGETVEGHSVDEAVPLDSTSGRFEATWTGGVGSFLGKPQGSVIRLRFHLMGAAKLYAFQIVAGPTQSQAVDSPAAASVPPSTAPRSSISYPAPSSVPPLATSIAPPSKSMQPSTIDHGLPPSTTGHDLPLGAPSSPAKQRGTETDPLVVMGTIFILMGFGMLFLVWLRRRGRSLEAWDAAHRSDGTPHRTATMIRAVGADVQGRSLRNRSDDSSEQQGIDMHELNDAAKAAAALEEGGTSNSDTAEPRRAKSGRLKSSAADDESD